MPLRGGTIEFVPCHAELTEIIHLDWLFVGKTNTSCDRYQAVISFSWKLIELNQKQIQTSNSIPLKAKCKHSNTFDCESLINEILTFDLRNSANIVLISFVQNHKPKKGNFHKLVWTQCRNRVTVASSPPRYC